MVEEILCCFCKALSFEECGKCCGCPKVCSFKNLCPNNYCDHISENCCKNYCSDCTGSEFNLIDCLCHCKFFEGVCCMKIEENCLIAFKFTENFSSCSNWFQGLCGGFSNSLFNCFSSVRCCFPDTCLLTLGYNFNLVNAIYGEDDDEDEEEEEEEKKKEEEKKRKEEEKRKRKEEKRKRKEEKNYIDDEINDENTKTKKDNSDDYYVNEEMVEIQVGDNKIDDDAIKQTNRFFIENEHENNLINISSSN
ncbi:hypothetical protein SteCoe_11451 [Stentor coeruleus]|uniref:Uncharacterized protein n=1 Tax=Stentor coeruleus TaxID=5963 RepID=A0A1R2CD50_9CILI|nr:hypothetical protein SteCoe_11451 [Stentor coeruleus]